LSISPRSLLPPRREPGNQHEAENALWLGIGQADRGNESKRTFTVSHAPNAPTLRQTLVAVAAVVFSMICVTGGAALAKSLFATIGPEGTTALRNGYGALMLLAFWRPWRSGRLTLKQWKAVALYGGCLGLMNLLFYCSLQYLPLGLAVAIEFIGPFTLALITSRRATDFLWLTLAVAGLALLLPWGDGPLAADPKGIALALGAGALWALYIVFGQKASRILPGGHVTSIGITIGSLITVPLGLAHAGSAMFAWSSLAVALGVALFSSAIPYSMDMVALRRVPARTFGIMMSLEPAVAALSGLILLGEGLTLRQQFAIGCVMVASFGSTSSARKVAPMVQEP
jgi:inner membrane transporter RhtA